MARRDDLVGFARRHHLKLCTVADIIAYRLRNETLVQKIAEAALPTAYGEFRAFVYRNLIDLTEHLVLVKGRVDPSVPILVRAHREYLPGDVFGYSLRNTRNLLRSAMLKVAEAGAGVILYLKRETNLIAAELNGNRARGLSSAYVSTHLNPPEEDFRDYGIGAQILRDVGVRKMVIMSDTKPRLANLPGYSLQIVDSVPLSFDEEPHKISHLSGARR